MINNIFLKIPFLLIRPKKYFEDVLVDKRFKMRDLLFLALVLVSLITVLHFVEVKLLERYRTGLELVVYLFSFVLGVVGSLIFRIYFLNLALKKVGAEVDLVKTGIIATIALISKLISIIVFSILAANQFDVPIKFVLGAWNLFLIFVGIRVLYKVSWYKGLILILLMFGLEKIFISIIVGMRL